MARAEQHKQMKRTLNYLTKTPGRMAGMCTGADVGIGNRWVWLSAAGRRKV